MLCIKDGQTYTKGRNTGATYVLVLALRVLAEMGIPNFDFDQYIEDGARLDLPRLLEDM